MISLDATRVAVQTALVSLASYLAGLHSTGVFHGASASLGGLWSAISGIVVLQATQRDTWSSAWLRLVGTAIGSIVSAAYLTMLPFGAIGMAASVFATVLICHGVRIPDHARLAAITVTVIMVTASLNPTLNPIQNAALRFSESCIGIAIAMLAVLMWPGPKEPFNTAPNATRDDAARS
jgi:uncharacterized membrane protein YgaE (UPF0421/DUF939 family)